LVLAGLKMSKMTFLKLFVSIMRKYGKNWTKIEEHIVTRNKKEIIKYASIFKAKVAKNKKD